MFNLLYARTEFIYFGAFPTFRKALKCFSSFRVVLSGTYFVQTTPTITRLMLI